MRWPPSTKATRPGIKARVPTHGDGPGIPFHGERHRADILPTPTSRGLYVYDYLRMWCFYLEPLAMGAAEDGVGYPRLMMEFGTTPIP